MNMWKPHWVIKHVFINWQIPLTFFRSLISWENIDSFVILVVFVNLLPLFLISLNIFVKIWKIWWDSFTYNLFQLLTLVNEFCNEKVNHNENEDWNTKLKKTNITFMKIVLYLILVMWKKSHASHHIMRWDALSNVTSRPFLVFSLFFSKRFQIQFQLPLFLRFMLFQGSRRRVDGGDSSRFVILWSSFVLRWCPWRS
jgi:hypothetical protein